MFACAVTAATRFAASINAAATFAAATAAIAIGVNNERHFLFRCFLNESRAALLQCINTLVQ